MLPRNVIILPILLAAIAQASPVHRQHKEQKELKQQFGQLTVALDREQISEKLELRVMDSLKDVTVQEGDAFEVLCETHAVPPAAISWLHDSRLIVSERPQTLFERLRNTAVAGGRRKVLASGATSSRLHVGCATKDHAGVYTCRADNLHAVVQRQVRVTVVPRDGGASCSVAKAEPVAVMWSDARVENQGNAVQLFCRSSNDRAKVGWLDADDKPIGPERPGFEQLPTGDLLVLKAAWEQMGVYGCVVELPDGRRWREDVFFYPTTPDTASDATSSPNEVQQEDQ